MFLIYLSPNSIFLQSIRKKSEQNKFNKIILNFQFSHLQNCSSSQFVSDRLHHYGEQRFPTTNTSGEFNLTKVLFEFPTLKLL